MMRPPRPEDLFRARELAEIALLDAALDVSARSLLHEHPTLRHWPGPQEPGSLRAARRLAILIRRLRTEIGRYRAALPRFIRAEDIPF